MSEGRDPDPPSDENEEAATDEPHGGQETAPSEALSLGSIGTIFSLGSAVLGGIIDHFKDGDSSQPQSRSLDQLKELLARADVEGSEAFELPSLLIVML